MKFRTWFILAPIISIILAIVSVYRPILTQQIVDIDILKLKDNNVLMKDIYFLIGLVVAETILNFFLVFFSNYIAQNVIRDIRERLYHKLIYFKTSFLIKQPSEFGDQSSRRRRNHCYGLYGWILMVFGDILKVVFVLVAMFQVNTELSYISLTILPIMLVITRFFQKN